ncbi:MAG: FAD-dependent monooxygenase, partial [Sphingomonadaceae bacterium]|nr:FAD-dependent monooxygenase [Sphingomonadaceae bacterium]
WYSIYTFQCRRMARFVHGRVIFAGDAAHLVSPFGARGCNGGVADADNLGWKLEAIVSGTASVALLESYNQEAIAIADENILNSTRSTDFMTPKSAISRTFRDAVLQLARHAPFARPFVNSGRLSTAVSFPNSPALKPDVDDTDGWRGVPPGSPAIDAPLGEGWLLKDNLSHGRFTLLTNAWSEAIEFDGDVDIFDISKHGDSVLAGERYDLSPGSAYLIRPDQYVAARWRSPTLPQVTAALQCATSGGSC